jgi:hypothetical protein
VLEFFLEWEDDVSDEFDKLLEMDASRATTAAFFSDFFRLGGAGAGTVLGSGNSNPYFS